MVSFHLHTTSDLINDIGCTIGAHALVAPEVKGQIGVARVWLDDNGFASRAFVILAFKSRHPTVIFLVPEDTKKICKVSNQERVVSDPRSVQIKQL